MPDKPAITRSQIVERLKRLRKEIYQIFLDAQHWNNIHPDEEPVNPDPDGKLWRMMTAIDKTLRREKIKVVADA